MKGSEGDAGGWGSVEECVGVQGKMWYRCRKLC